MASSIRNLAGVNDFLAQSAKQQQLANESSKRAIDTLTSIIPNYEKELRDREEFDLRKRVLDRQEEEYQRGVKDRNALEQYGKMMAEAPQQRAIFTEDVNAQPKYDAMSYSDRELALIGNTDVSDTDVLRKNLASSGATEQEIGSILDKTRQQLKLSDIASTARPQFESGTEKVDRVVKTMQEQGIPITPAILQDIEKRKAADIEVRKLREKSATSQLDSANKTINSLEQKLSKALDERNSSGNSSSKGKNKYLKNDAEYNDSIAKAKSKVTWGGIALPGTDASGIEGVENILKKSNIPLDERAFIINGLVEPGFFGNSVPSGSDLTEGIRELRNSYEKGVRSSSKANTIKTLNRQLLEAKADRDSAQRIISGVGKTAQETRDSYVDSLLDRIGVSRPTTETTTPKVSTTKSNLDEFGQDKDEIAKAEQRMIAESDKRAEEGSKVNTEDRIKELQEEFQNSNTTPERKAQLQNTALQLSRAEALREKMARGGFTKMSDSTKKEWEMVGKAIQGVSELVKNGSSYSTGAIQSLMRLLDKIELGTNDDILQNKRNIIPPSM